MIEIWLTEPYYRDYRKRKGWLFDESEKYKLFDLTQTLQRNWPKCATDPSIPPELGTGSRLYYLKCDFTLQQATFRVAFGYHDIPGTQGRLVALTCRTKEELSRGSQNGTAAWYDHIATVGRARWRDYHTGHIAAWRIYRSDGTTG